MRHRVELSKGDVSSFVYDDETKRLEIWQDDEDPLIQAQMTETERSRLILVLRSANGKIPD